MIWAPPPPRAAEMLEAAYRLDLPSEAWLDGIHRVATASLRGMRCRLAVEFEIDAANTMSFRAMRGDPPELVQAASTRIAEGGSALMFRTALSGKLTFTFSQVLDPRWDRRFLQRFDLADYWVINGTGMDRAGVLLAAGLSAPAKSLKSEAAASWSRIAAHLAAATRLRRRLARGGAAAECVLSPGGRVVHAEGPARRSASREALSHAVRAIDRACSRERRSDPDEVLGAWTSLVAGRWTVVAQIDTDGRRLILARVNEPQPWLQWAGASVELTTRERQVAELAARGHSNKFVGYELGLQPSTVAWHVRRIADKLGARSRIELVRMLARTLSASLDPPLTRT
jgi:DNA-binding CsgD family transcriptional regulator